MHTHIHLPLVRLLLALTVAGCAGQPLHERSPPPGTIPPPPPAVSMEVDAYIADVRRLIAEMDQVEAEGESMPDVSALQDNLVFHETLRILDAFFLQAMQLRTMQVYLDNVRRFDEQMKEDRKLHEFIQGVIGYHARLMYFTAHVMELSKKIDAMEPRWHALQQKLSLAVAQHPSGSDYADLMILLHNEQQRFERKIDQWTDHTAQQY
jgi:hypothetical protein